MAENSGAEDQVPVEDLSPEEASRIIHSHRKVRYGMQRPQHLSRMHWVLDCSLVSFIDHAATTLVRHNVNTRHRHRMLAMSSGKLSPKPSLGTLGELDSNGTVHTSAR